MADESSDEKTEEATQTRRDEFRKRGQVAHSKELASAVLFIAAAILVSGLSHYFVGHLQDLFQRTLGGDLVHAVREGDFWAIVQVASFKYTVLITPIFAIFGVLGLASFVVQMGFLQVEDALQPKLERISPLKGFSRLFSLRNLAEGIKSLLKLLLVSGITYLVLKGEMAHIPMLIRTNVTESSGFLGSVLFKLFFSLGLGVLSIAVLDYFFQRWDLERQMRMTKEEVKQEHKNQEGDPLIKARVRRIQRQLANRKMMQEVPKADVIITNPTHIAVALKYDANLPAPQLIAMGADLIAQKIKDLAREKGIPIVENKPLARTIFKTMKIGQVIPRELFVAVAEVLSYVYKLRRRKRSI